MRPKRALLLVVIVLALVGLWVTRDSWLAVQTKPQLGSHDGPQVSVRALDPLADDIVAAVPLNGWHRSFAQAYAVAGQQADGRDIDVAALPQAVQELLPQARAVLQEQAVSNWRQLQQSSAAATATGGDTRLGGTGVDDGVGAMATPGAASGGTDRVASATEKGSLPEGHTFPRQRAAYRPPPAGSLQQDRNSLVLKHHDLWADLRFVPQVHAEQGLQIDNADEQAYVLQVQADDTGDIRLDGGLIVPGRFYLIRGSARITGASPAHIAIRPVDAVTGFHPHVARPPQTSG